MPQSPSTRSPLPGRVPITGIRDGHFFQSVSLGILGALFGVVAVCGFALVVHSSSTPKASIDEQTSTQLIADRQKEREAEFKRVESKKAERRLEEEREAAELIAGNETENDRRAQETERRREQERKDKNEAEELAAEEIANKKQMANKKQNAGATTKVKKPQTQNLFADIPDNILLPPWNPTSKERSKETFIAPVNIKDPKNCTLNIVGTKDSGLAKERTFKCTFETIQGKEYPVREWTVTCTGAGLARDEVVATFRLHNTKLYFKWVTAENNLAECLGNAGIELTANNPEETKKVSFRQVKTHEPIRLAAKGTTRTFVLLENVLPGDLGRYVFRSEIAGLDKQLSIKVVKATRRDEGASYVWAPLPPAINGIKQLDIRVTTTPQGGAVLETVAIQKKDNFGDDSGHYVAIYLELFHDRPTKQLRFKITQRLDEPVFTATKGVTWPRNFPANGYHYGNLLTFKDTLTMWKHAVETAIRTLPADIVRAQQLIASLNIQLSNGTGNKDLKQRQLVDAQIKLNNLNASIPKTKKAKKDLAGVEEWRVKVDSDMKNLLDHFRIDFDLTLAPDSSEPDSSEREIVVSSNGGE